MRVGIKVVRNGQPAAGVTLVPKSADYWIPSYPGISTDGCERRVVWSGAFSNFALGLLDGCRR